MGSLWFFQPHYRLERLLFNSYYHVEVEMDKTWYGKVGFLTSECPDVDTRTYTKCPSLFNNIGLKFDRIQIAEKKTTYHHLLRHTGSYFHFY
jgi:hypothetical protein